MDPYTLPSLRKKKKRTEGEHPAEAKPYGGVEPLRSRGDDLQAHHQPFTRASPAPGPPTRPRVARRFCLTYPLKRFNIRLRIIKPESRQ